MGVINSAITIDDARRQGNDVYEVLVSNWGNYAVGAPTSEQGFPAEDSRGLPAPAAIAIGPRSTVDRAWVVYDLQKVVPSASIFDYPRRVSVGAPLTFPQPSDQIGTGGSVKTGTGSLFVLPTNGGLNSYNGWNNQYNPTDTYGTIYRDGTYYKADGTTGTLGPSVGATSYWMSPLLHLYVYLKPPVSPPPTKRFPLCVGIAQGGQAGVETLLALIPTYGRKTLSFNYRVIAPGGSAVVRIATVGQVGLGMADTPFEVTRYTSGAVATGLSGRTEITNLNADYTLVYMTPTVIGNLKMDIIATDD